jgi:hypothetical protein
MDLGDDELQRFAAADRRVIDPPIQVEMATWTKAGQLDWWWVNERQQWWGRAARSLAPTRARYAAGGIYRLSAFTTVEG